ncbi:tRNA 2-selenouridine(34) synthase MnmH [Polluticoccus soli]|uniref:tRNA 2-selenouridine(34) synthase MnmH n=1 Tax=Polluticoccus soli TaxID=3034150 RepID=UPI0023E0AE25|nr:tRNA 2-selenouridine(34) synthase MnmH [Flavipsychrobacter sp. JY13-12]
MGVSRIEIDEFLSLSLELPVFDVRSPSEFCHASFPSAFNLPLFSDGERKIVGTLYKQQSRQNAIKAGLDFFGPKMRMMVEEAEAICGQFNTNRVLVHCWRGGMRSAGVAWLLDLYGFKVYTLAGGYKAFRQWALKKMDNSYPLRVIGGFTGSGKTELLGALASYGEVVVDLEDIAKHKGSAFGDLEGVRQPSQEMFENILAMRLDAAMRNSQATEKPIWIEDESQRIGLVNIPGNFWKGMRGSPLYFLEIPFEHRLQYLVKEYGSLPKEKLVTAIMRIQKRLGGLDTKLAINHLLENNIEAAFNILLSYYDKYYKKAQAARDNFDGRLKIVESASVDSTINLQKLLAKI